MPPLHTYRIFISHAWKYNAEYYRLINFLNSAPYFKYANYSVPQHDPIDAGNKKKLTEKLKNQIRPVEVVIILGGMYASYSDWIQFEIDFSKLLEKSILGVRPRGALRMPKAVQDASDEIVGWNTNSIVSAIRKLA